MAISKEIINHMKEMENNLKVIYKKLKKFGRVEN